MDKEKTAVRKATIRAEAEGENTSFLCHESIWVALAAGDKAAFSSYRHILSIKEFCRKKQQLCTILPKKPDEHSTP